MKVGWACCGLLLGLSTLACQVYYHTAPEGSGDGDVVMEPDVKDSLKRPEGLGEPEEPTDSQMEKMDAGVEPDASSTGPRTGTGPDEENSQPDASAPLPDASTSADAGASVPKKECRAYSDLTTIFLNFGSVKLKNGEKDKATSNISAIALKDVTINRPAFTDAQRKKIVDIVTFAFRRFHVKVVTERPSQGQYTMVVFADRIKDLGYSGADPAGIAKLDCANFNRENIGFVFLRSIDESEGVTPAWLAVMAGFAAAHEAAHTLGLVHVNHTDDTMFPSLAFQTDRTFLNEENMTYGKACRGGEKQNDYATLLAILGDATGCVPPVQ